MDKINEFNAYQLSDIVQRQLIDNLTEQALKTITADLRVRVTELVLSMKPRIETMLDHHADSFILKVLFSGPDKHDIR